MLIKLEKRRAAQWCIVCVIAHLIKRRLRVRPKLLNGVEFSVSRAPHPGRTYVQSFQGIGRETMGLLKSTRE